MLSSRMRTDRRLTVSLRMGRGGVSGQGRGGLSSQGGGVSGQEGVWMRGVSLADLGGTPGPYPPMAQNVLNFMQFFRKLGNFVCWHPLDVLRPLLCGILDPPLGQYVWLGDVSG